MVNRDTLKGAMNRPPTRPPSRPAAPRSKRPDPAVAKRRQIAVVAGVALLALVLYWLLRPAPLDNVANLDSRGTTIVAFGDSLTAGYGAGRGESYPERLSMKLGIPIENAGVSGDTTAGALDRLDREVLTRDPRIVIVGLGGNDFLRGAPIASAETNLRAIVRRIREAGAVTILLGFRFPSLTADWEGMYERVAEEEQCLFVPDVLDGILSDPALRSDAIHPNAAGYQVMAERVAGPLKRLIDD